MFGKFGRARLSAFSNRQYPEGQNHTLNAEMSEIAPWWVGAISNSIPRRVTFLPSPPLIVYTYASGCGHVGAVLFDSNSHTAAHSHILHG